MEVKIADRGEKEVVIALSGVKVRFANALRRVMIAEVPKLAIDELNIRENTSLLYDEQLALRLALVPLKTDLKEYKEEDQITLTLKATSPEKAGYTMVYSKELISSYPKVEAASGNIPIVKLISTEKEIGAIKTVARQKIDLDAIARWGRGGEHAKWQPVTICGYKDVSDEDVNDLLFTVESDGALPVDEIILEAARIMQEKCERMVEALKELS
uniref:DNA-directed RNA polymerase subunit Rpo3 n=1 Tax=Candidatus Methanophaga sp. ANME-1 ERB7 TaxID=2759913 RepID=A0A7G9Z2C9_9EURY|nr:DNA-directed RNA polymerase subunit D [Methanosarcinales archaeon ANME-1 ERB7]